MARQHKGTAHGAVIGFRVATCGSPKQTWRTFLRNHIDSSAGRVFFTVPTLTCRLLYVFVVLSHDCQRILHFSVTKHPTTQWTARQLTEACSGDKRMSRVLHRDRHAIRGDIVRTRIGVPGIEEIVRAERSPRQKPDAERVVGSIRRDCTDQLNPLDETHLRTTLGEYATHYNRPRCHQSLAGSALEPRPVHDGAGCGTPSPTSASYTTDTVAAIEVLALLDSLG